MFMGKVSSVYFMLMVDWLPIKGLLMPYPKDTTSELIGMISWKSSRELWM